MNTYQVWEKVYILTADKWEVINACTIWGDTFMEGLLYWALKWGYRFEPPNKVNMIEFYSTKGQALL